MVTLGMASAEAAILDPAWASCFTAIPLTESRKKEDKLGRNLF